MWLSNLLIIAAWMCGGQWNKAYRRFGIPIVIIATITMVCLHGGVWWHYLLLVGLFPELFLGYGSGSWAGKLFKQEWAIRLAYAVMLWIPIAVSLLILGRLLYLPTSLCLLVGAFQIRAGSLFKVGAKDFLIEDFFRSLAVGLCLDLVVIH